MNSFDYYNLGRKLLDSGKIEDGLKNLEISAELSPHFKTLELIGCEYLKKKKFAKAILHLAASACLNRQVRPRAYLCKALFENGQHEDAKQHAELVLEKEPFNKIANEIIIKLKDRQNDE